MQNELDWERKGYRVSGDVVDPDWVKGSEAFETARAVLSFCQSMQTGICLDRRNLKPEHLGRLLPRTALVEVLEGGADYRWRIFGQAHEDILGMSLKGRTLVERITENPTAAGLKAIFDACLQRRAFQYFEQRYTNLFGVYKVAHGVVIPLTDGGADIRYLLGASDWH